MSFVPLGGSTTKPTSSFTPIDTTPTAPPPQAQSASPSFFSKVVNGTKSIVSDIGTALFAPQPSQSFNPMEATNAATGTFLDSLTSAGHQVVSNASKALTDFGSGNILKGTVDTGQAAFGVLNGLFAPINSFVAYAQHIPGVGSVATGLNNVFNAIGTGGADAATAAVNTLPVSQETKDTIRPLAAQIGSLAAQIIAGHVGGEAFKAIGDHSKTIVDTVASDPLVQEHMTLPDENAPQTATHETAPTEAATEQAAPTATPASEPPGFTEAPPETPAAAPEAVKPVEAVSALTPEATELLQKIDAGGSAPAFISNNLRRIATENGIAIENTMTPNDIVAALRSNEGVGERSVATPEPSTTSSGETARPLKTEPGVSKIGKSIEVKAIDAQLTQRFDKTAGYDPITIKDQAERATALVNDNLDEARAVVRGEKPLPEGLRGVSLVTALEEHLTKQPDAHLAYELANSPLVSGTSAAAQELRLAAERTPDSITAKFKEIKAAREAALEKKGGLSKNVKKIVDDIQKEVKKNAVKRPDWESFISDLTCKV